MSNDPIDWKAFLGLVLLIVGTGLFVYVLAVREKAAICAGVGC